MRRIDELPDRRAAALAATHDDVDAGFLQLARLHLVLGDGQQGNAHQCTVRIEHMPLTHIRDVEVLDGPPANCLLHDLADMIRVQVDLDALLMALDEREARVLAQMALEFRHIHARVADREAHAVRAHEVLAWVRQPELTGLKAEREADRRRDEIAVEALEAARQEGEHDARTGILLPDLRQRLLARLDGCLQDL